MLQDLVRATHDGVPLDADATPERVVLAAGRTHLRLIWNERDATDVAADRLRGACRCAWCTRGRIDGTFAQPSTGLTIDRLEPVGGYAVNIAFSDGHARGVYPWVYLRKLARDNGSIA